MCSVEIKSCLLSTSYGFGDGFKYKQTKRSQLLHDDYVSSLFFFDKLERDGERGFTAVVLP
jgi:hypothetical protein